MTYAQIALLLLQLVKFFVDRSRERGLIKQGEDEEIARATAEIWKKTVVAKKIMEEISAMDEAKVDAALRGLERVPDNNG